MGSDRAQGEAWGTAVDGGAYCLVKTAGVMAE